MLIARVLERFYIASCVQCGFLVESFLNAFDSQIEPVNWKAGLGVLTPSQTSKPIYLSIRVSTADGLVRAEVHACRAAEEPKLMVPAHSAACSTLFQTSAQHPWSKAAGPGREQSRRAGCGSLKGTAVRALALIR